MSKSDWNVKGIQQHYIALGSQCWGKATTITKAIANCKANGSPFKDGKFALFLVDESASVNEWGGIDYNVSGMTPVELNYK